jgi:SAM-dependent methyltransferase
MDSAVQKKIWDHWQGARPESFGHATARLAWLASRVRGRVLNIGVGNGEFERAALGRGVEIHALDPSPAAIEGLRSSLGLGERARCGSATSIPWDDGTFDWVVASEVLEHLDDETLDRSIAEIARVLAPSGGLLGTVPARENLDEQRVLCPYCEREFHRWGHERSFDRDGLASLLDRHLRVESIRERVFVTWRLLNTKGRALALVRLALSVLGRHVSNANWVFVARRKSGA